jgi:ribA/ribD-fused uncharacterized protein
MINKNECVFFYGGIHSQWYRSPFTFNGVEFNCAEQFMMYGKAMHFKDYASAKAILATTDPQKQKALGRAVKNYDYEQWSVVGYRVVVLGTFLKATQNTEVFDNYADNFNDGKRLYVEASLHDKIWGIGLSLTDALAYDVNAWNGTNLLGKAITEVSDLLLVGKDNGTLSKMALVGTDVAWVTENITSIFD